MASTDTENYSSRYRWYVVFLLMCVYACNLADRALLSVLVEPIKAEFGLSDSMMGFIGGTLFATTYAVFTVPFGWLTDRVNRRNLLVICLAGWSLMTAISGLARSIVHLATAQVLVAIGESASPPTMSSLISDLFPREKRGLAMAIWFTGVSIGMFVGYTLGGILAESLGWRATFLWLGIPGVILAVIVRFTVRETPRGLADGNVNVESKQPKLAEALQFILQQKALRHTIYGGTLIGLAIMGPIYWLTAFFIRTHDLTIGEAGPYVGLILGITGVIGGPIGGYLMDRMGQRDLRWHAWLVVLLMLACTIPMSVLYLSNTLAIAIIGAVIWNTLTTGIPVIIITMVSNLAAAQFRGLSISIYLLLFNLFGYGMGSQIVGLGSDWIDSTYGLGQDSLRYACLAMMVFAIWGAIHFWIAASHVKEGYETAADRESN
jgi:predicted MFS family arabinose efflux permease